MNPRRSLISVTSTLHNWYIPISTVYNLIMSRLKECLPSYDNSPPLYRQIEMAIRNMVDSYEYSMGDRIPSERDLADQFEVSRMTVRKAVDSLVLHGVLERDSTSGTRVKGPSISRFIGVETSSSLSKVLQASGATAGSKLLFFHEQLATKKLAERLKLSVGSTLFVIKRLRSADEQPFCIETSYISKNLIPGLIAADIIENNSLYKLLTERYSISLTTGEQRISISYATPEEATLMALEVGMPILLQQAVVNNQEGAPFEYVKSVNHPELVVFRTSGDF